MANRFLSRNSFEVNIIKKRELFFDIIFTMPETDQEQEKLNELEDKITAVLEQRLSEAIKNRDVIDGPRGLKPPGFWTYHAEVTSLTQQIARRKNR